ncbi:methylated-DNA--[protein]-cysteine S-methyltransferase [Paludibacter sp. 221]|uniref:methylated-DNA--[protein]-cysteine S-methyltransferase n=1 Tax=Paludibacter sp. 221 TaxID=2302939 RepID=UPI0013D80C23|nr:methylated-DNA--[protein]-cysteine S-methyltransferase [Paludibacter sp. 221]NDV47279.1 methylated-DNA--[protein]-cysteine S-methyltransferase [Paludibacter sp. 221]
MKTDIGKSPSKGSVVIYQTKIQTPLGIMYACATGKGICLLEFDNRKNIDSQFRKLAKSLGGTIADGESVYFQQLKNELEEYFGKKRKIFTVPLDLVGTDFQKEVWSALLKIPQGETVSYKQLATRIGDTKAVRAVANANAMNKIAIIVPCHRIIGSDNSLTGYAGGLDRKMKLLNLEGIHRDLFS